MQDSAFLVSAILLVPYCFFAPLPKPNTLLDSLAVKFKELLDTQYSPLIFERGLIVPHLISLFILPRALRIPHYSLSTVRDSKRDLNLSRQLQIVLFSIILKYTYRVRSA
ncbi:hypothetical protein EYC84_003283 [Monilinia fructicola]|uniref:Uncharacterized protein n=1 Tax=Monilinia fructicola TaxID=38448 RepID=A0A5M9JX25_MONFR|nr:hypothetical protein EYC84_003283 [Monilinia fructicola]